MPREAPGAFNQALMDLGAGVCLPNSAPLCDSCPAAAFCAAREQGCQRELPVRAPKKEKRREEKPCSCCWGRRGWPCGSGRIPDFWRGCGNIPMFPDG